MKKKFFAVPLMCVAVAGMVMTGCNKEKGLSDYSKYVKLGDYTGLKIEVEPAEVTDEQVEEEFDALIEYYTTKEEIKEGVVGEKDSINLDFTGYLDGKAFEGGSTDGKGTDYTIGGGYIADLNDQLIGLEVGKKYELECTFPEDYGKEELNGKTVIFEVTVNCIYGEDVVPELTDDLIKEHTEGDYTTVAAYEAYLREELYKLNVENQQLAYEYGIWSTIIETSERNGFPEDVLKVYYDGYYNDYKNYYTQMAAAYSMEYETFLLLYVGKTDKEIQEYCQELAESELEYTMVAVEIAKAEGITITDKEIESQKDAIVESYTYEDKDALEEQYKDYGDNYFMESFIFDKVNEFLAENNEMVVSESASEDASEDSSEKASE